MRAIGITEFGGGDKLQIMDLPRPALAGSDILIQIRAAGVNPVDWKIREGMLRHRLPHEFPLVPGWDAAGVVTEVGVDVRRFSAGQEVYAYCRKPVVKEGTYAEYVSVPETGAALKPKNMSFEEAATVPLAALTACQALFDVANLSLGETVLIHAAAGGVGTFAVQLAKQRGACVIGTAGAKNHEHIRRLGVDIPLDYHSVDFREAIRRWQPEGVDVVFDCAGGDTLKRSVDVLARNGRLVSIVDAHGITELKKNGRSAEFVFVKPNGAQLDALTRLIEAGHIKTSIAAAFPLEEAAKAHELSETHHTCGKLVLTL